MKIPNCSCTETDNPVSLARIVSEDSQLSGLSWSQPVKSSKDS